MKFFREMYDGNAPSSTARAPSRLVGVQGGPTDWLGLFDVVCINRYYGWYILGGRLDEGAQELATRARRAAQARSANRS